eukprot:scaffold90116_cov45-Phaeocystis_antarctica.AAC.2
MAERRMRAPTKLAWIMPVLFTFLAFSAWGGAEEISECGGGGGGGGGDADGTSSSGAGGEVKRGAGVVVHGRGGGGAFMAICHLALIFFQPSTYSAHGFAQSACSAHAVHMQCTCSAHAVRMQCASICPVSIHTLYPMAMPHVCRVQLPGSQLYRGAAAHLHAARFDHSEQCRASTLRCRA